MARTKQTGRKAPTKEDDDFDSSDNSSSEEAEEYDEDYIDEEEVEEVEEVEEEEEEEDEIDEIDESKLDKIDSEGNLLSSESSDISEYEFSEEEEEDEEDDNGDDDDDDDDDDDESSSKKAFIPSQPQPVANVSTTPSTTIKPIIPSKPLVPMKPIMGAQSIIPSQAPQPSKPKITIKPTQPVIQPAPAASTVTAQISGPTLPTDLNQLVNKLPNESDQMFNYRNKFAAWILKLYPSLYNQLQANVMAFYATQNAFLKVTYEPNIMQNIVAINAAIINYNSPK